jgi:hypothetical protein
MAILAADVAGS